MEVTVQAQPSHIWAVLTEAEHLAQWYGEPSAGLTQITQFIEVKIGPTQLVNLFVDKYEPPNSLHFTIADIGTTSPYSVIFQVEGIGNGSLVTMLLPEATYEARSALKQLWTSRLAAIVSLAEFNVAIWPGDIHKEIVLPSDLWPPLHDRNLIQWLPYSERADGSRYLYIVDDVGPRPLLIQEWFAHYDESLDIDLDSPVGTHIAISVTSEERGLCLNLNQTNWWDTRSGSTPPPEPHLRLRHQFHSMWSAALDNIASLAQQQGQ